MNAHMKPLHSKQMMSISFEGKRILVTGAGGGIGRVLALRLAKHNAYVFALSKSKTNLESLMQTDPTGRIHAVVADLSNWDETTEAVKRILPIDMLVNNAGVAILSPFADIKPADFDKTMDINVKAIINVSQVVTESMIQRKTGGSIVNVSSQASKMSLKDHAVYSTSKAALDMLTKSMAFELGEHNIRVNCVNPTVVMTPMGIANWSDSEKAGKMLARIPLGRFAEIDEVVEPIMYLLSDYSSMITGICLPVDGGAIIT